MDEEIEEAKRNVEFWEERVKDIIKLCTTAWNGLKAAQNELQEVIESEADSEVDLHSWAVSGRERVRRLYEHPPGEDDSLGNMEDGGGGDMSTYEYLLLGWGN